MANQGFLAQLKPSANTDTVLYRSPINQSASTVLSIANDGTGSTFDVAVKDYDQKLTLDASTYKLHRGDLITSYYITLDTDMTTATGIAPGEPLVTDDKEKSFNFESFFIPTFTEIFVKEITLRNISAESVVGEFQVGETITKGSAPNTTTAVVFAVVDRLIYVTIDGKNKQLRVVTVTVGPSTLNGTGTEFTDGDSIASASSSGTISTGGVGTGVNKFVFSTTTAGGTYDTFSKLGLPFFDDRAYRFNTSDVSMSGTDFKLSTTINGLWGPDGLAASDPSDAGDAGTEYTTQKTTNGTAGSAGAYIQYDFAGSNAPSTLYYFDGDTGTAAKSSYGGTDHRLVKNTVTYSGFYIYDKVGTIVNSSDSFVFNAVTYTITAQSAGAYGYVKDYDGTSLKFVKGLNSADWSGSDTFRDVPALNTAARTVATISSIDVASGAVEGSNYIAVDHANAANNDERITSLVIGPGEVVVVNSTTQNNVFSLIGYLEDSPSAITPRVYGQS